MNTHLSKLQEAMESRHGVSAEQLRDVLFLLRAHYNLAGIVMCCRRLVELLDHFSWLEAALTPESHSTFLSVVRTIASLKDADSHFLADTTRRNKNKETPLRPFSGDSALCDLLLIKPGHGTSETQNEVYSWAQAWFAAQVVRYQTRTHRKTEYFAYLDQQERDKGMSRLIDGQGSRVYGAMRLLRMLGDPAHEALTHEVFGLVKEWGLEGSEQFIDLLAAALKKRGVPGVGLIAERYGGTTDEVQRRIAHLRTFDQRFGRREQGEDAADLRLLARFLESVWTGKRTIGADRIAAITKRIRDAHRKLNVERYGEIEALPQRVERGIGNGGILVDVRLSGRRPKGGDKEEDAPAHRDSDDGPVEPDLQIFVGNGDPVGAYYAAKSASHHVEAENALLRWPQWRMSEAGLEAVCALITSTADTTPLTDWARLLIAVSLASGRRFPAAVFKLIADDPLPDDQPAITITDKVLHVPAAKPHLKGHVDTSDPLPEFCAPWAPTLRLPLPRAWHPLVERLAHAPKPRTARIESAADALLEALPAELAVTEKGVAHALRLALLEAGRDDLALVKVLTDASEANTANLIHYASYPRHEVEALWASIVSRWAGPLADCELPGRHGERVGSPFGLEVSKVASAVAALKAEVREAFEAKDWARGQTLITIYLALWLGLGTAGRGTRHPIPPFINNAGWALVQDKHRPDESTDRFVPLSEPLRLQIDRVRTLAEAFAVADPAFDAPDPEAPDSPPLRLFVKNQPALFQPSHWRVVDAIKALPRNWARRLVRSESPELLGRFKDAGLGHWVRGRHPWSWTSTFPAQVFARDWLAVQARLEAALGFEILEVPWLADHPRRPTQHRAWSAARSGHEEASSATKSTLTDEAIQGLFRACSKNGEFETLIEHADPEVGRWLLLRALAKLHGTERTSADPTYTADAVAMGAYLRRTQNLCFFVNPPRARFQRNWMVASNAFSDLLRVEREFLPAIEADLSALPPIEDNNDVRIGRLIAAVAVRVGLLDTQHIDAFFIALANGGSIHAVGEARLIELRVRTKRSSMPVRRTVLLEPFVSVLLMTEAQVLDEVRHPYSDRLIPHRYLQWDGYFRAYLGALKLEDEPSLPRFLAALRQKLMLEASPILAAYASAELPSFDLPISEFCRLAGYAMRPSEVPVGHSELQDPVKDRAVWADAEYVLYSQKPSPNDDEAMPKDLQQRSSNLAHRFSSRSSPYLSEWMRLTKLDLKPLKLPADRLLGLFAKHLIQEVQQNSVGKKRAASAHRFKREISRNLKIVWAALAQFREQPEALNPLGDRTLRRLIDLTADHFSLRQHRAAWSRFRTFLLSADAAEAGIPIKVGNETPDEFVSAKILSRKEMDSIEALLGSVQSGIGTAANRYAAQGHFGLTRDLGARRSETELLRQVDVDGELVRIREYEGRTLKTKASSRAVPLQLLCAELRARFHQRSTAGTLLGTLAGQSVSGTNFYDRVSKAMKEATGDPDVGLHHLRHSKASLMLLRMLGNVVPLDRLAIELPWLPASLPTEAEAETLLGSAGQAGQGMKAISALLGHLHETTTLHHYVHTLGIAMHAHALAQPPISLARAFHRRLSMGSSLYRHQQELEVLGHSPQVQTYRLRAKIEAHEERAHRRSIPVPRRTPLLRSSLPLDKRPVILQGSPLQDAVIQLLDRWESLQKGFFHGTGSSPEVSLELRSRLRDLAAIGSGKVGSKRPRHPMPLLGDDGTPLPQPLLPGLPVKYAAALIAWLLRLHRDHFSDFEWLIDRWLHASHSISGAMRLSRPGDLERARGLSLDEAVRIEISTIHQTKSRARIDPKPRYQMTIKLGAKAGVNPRGSGGKKEGWRSAGAVRWVMTWAAVAFESPLQAAQS